MHDPLPHKLGRIITRVLLAPRVRSLPGIQWLYTKLYLLGKSLSEQKEVRFFQTHLMPGMTIIDIGANVGFYTSVFAKRVGPSGRVIAFEPDPLCFRILQKRTAEILAVTIEQCALGREEGHGTLHINESNRADNRIHGKSESGETAEIEITTLDAYCASHGITHIDAIKMDIQGAEVECLEGMKHLMQTMPPTWMLIEFSPDDLASAGSSAEEFWKILSKYEYESYELRNDEKPQRIVDKNAFTNQIGNGYTNIWAWRGN